MDLIEHASATGVISQLSSTEHSILTYLVTHEDDIAEATVSSIARATFSSTASVIRLSKKLGFAGFSELKFFVKNFRAQDSTFRADDLISGAQSDTVGTVTQLLDLADISTPVELIHKARIVYLCATGYSQRLAGKEFTKSLINYGYFSVLIPSELELEHGINAIRSDDVVVILSLSGATPGYERILDKLQSRSVPIICLAANAQGYIAQRSDHVLTYQSTAVPMGGGHKDFVSLIGLYILIDYLIRCLVILNKEEQ